MKRREVIVLLGAVSIAKPLAVIAQPARDKVKIGFLSAAPLSSITARTKALLDGLNELGYVDGKNMQIEWRSADEHWDRLPQLADDLAKLKVAVIVTAEGPATIAAKKTTATVPIVMGQSGDPVKMGVVSSLAHPGTNVTGLTTLSTDLPGKQVELLKEAVPRLSKLAVLFNPANALSDAGWNIVRATAKTLGLALVSQSVSDAKQFRDAFAATIKAGANGLLVLPDPMFLSQRAQIAALAAKYKLPAIYGIPEYAEAGGLIAYAASRTDSFRRAAVYVDKIIKGAKPADLPVEQPTKFELAINMKTANALGVKIPNSILVRADKVIE